MSDYFVLRTFDPDAVEDPFHEAFGGVIDRLAEQHALHLTPTGRTETDIQIIVPWEDEGKSIELTMYDNYLVMVRHLELRGDHAVLPLLAQDLRQALPILAPRQHLAAVADELEADPRLVFQVALAAPDESDPDFVDFLRRALEHPVSNVRNVAAQAVNLLGWPQLLELLRAAHAGERPGLAKATMGTALRAWNQI